MKLAILGYGSQGASALEYWSAKGALITVCDQSTELQLPEGVETQLGDDYLHDLDRFDLIVRSPSVHPRDIVAANPSLAIHSKVTTNTNEFMNTCPTRNIIGVTGTKGKGTTSTLITNMLQAAGFRVHLGGNIGTPPLELLEADIQPNDWVVLELANFQLIDLKQSPHIAVCLMITSEHQDWHEDFEEYVAAKQQLFINQTVDDIAIYYSQNQDSLDIAAASEGTLIPYMKKPGALVQNDAIVIDNQRICGVEEIKLLGKHNWQNICAAVTAVWQITQNTEAIRSVATSFSGMEYRLERIRELDGVQYYNDSFGTTPETAIVAVEAFTQPKILIAGGSDKGADFDDMAQAIVDNNVKLLITIGQMGPTIAQLVRSKNSDLPIIEDQTAMADAVQTAHDHAEPGDIVLLSTGSASFGMFQNYKDRGNQFNEAVRALPEAQ